MSRLTPSARACIRIGQHAIDIPRVVRMLALTCCATIASLAHAAPVITVIVEQGLSFLPSSDAWTLQQGGALATYTASSYDYQQDQPESFDFTLRYAGSLFTMTALADNNVATVPSLPYGLGVHLGGGYSDPRVGFIPWFDFPTHAGGVVSVQIPDDPPAVPEASSVIYLALGLACVGLHGIRRRQLTPAP